jgi:YidC/Oxa1 family membrane protein insertase
MKFDKNTVIGFALMVLMLLGFMYYQTKQAHLQQVAEQQLQDSLAKVEAARPKPAPTAEYAQDNAAPLSDSVRQALKSTASLTKYGMLATAATGEAQEVTMQNGHVKVTLNTKGGLFSRAELIGGDYKNYHTKENVRLWDESISKMKLLFNLYGKGSFKSDEFYFVPSASSVDATTADGQLSMKLATSDPSKYIELNYTLKPDAYKVDMNINVVGLGNDLELGNKPLVLEWYAVGNNNEKGISAERTRSSVYYREMDEDRDYLSETSSDNETTTKAVNWVAFKQNYFSAAIISNEGFTSGSNLQINPAQDSAHTKYYWANLILPVQTGTHSSTPLTFYFGPNDFKELKNMEVEEFDRIIDYGWSIIGTVNRYVVRPLFWFFSSFIGSWGLIILLVTLVIKTILFPVTWKNFLSSAKMRVLRPEIEEINKKYEGKDDAMGKQQATMALYRETGVNPFAGCIPVILQMPILYAMFRFFPAEIVLRGKSFLWADDLAAYDHIWSWSQQIPVLSSIYGNHISGFTILMCVSTFIYSKMSMGAQPQMAQQPGMPNMAVMMNIFTVMMLFFFNNQPAGLTLYYFIANVVSISQMLLIKKYFIDEKAIRAKIEANKAKPKKSKSNFMQRLEEAQKIQKQKLEQQSKKKK